MLPEDEEETLQKKTLKPRRRGSAPQTRIAGRGRRSRGNDNNQLPQDSTTTKKKILARSPLDKIPIAEAVVPTACRFLRALETSAYNKGALLQRRALIADGIFLAAGGDPPATLARSTCGRGTGATASARSAPGLPSANTPRRAPWLGSPAKTCCQPQLP
jgi:hypothetical protein